jgi:hypothetical protein
MDVSRQTGSWPLRRADQDLRFTQRSVKSNKNHTICLLSPEYSQAPISRPGMFEDLAFLEVSPLARWTSGDGLHPDVRDVSCRLDVGKSTSVGCPFHTESRQIRKGVDPLAAALLRSIILSLPSMTSGSKTELLTLSPSFWRAKAWARRSIAERCPSVRRSSMECRSRMGGGGARKGDRPPRFETRECLCYERWSRQDSGLWTGETGADSGHRRRRSDVDQRPHGGWSGHGHGELYGEPETSPNNLLTSKLQLC